MLIFAINPFTRSEEMCNTASVLGRALKLKKKSRRELDIGAVRC